jgi:hypothetical protein
MSTGQADKPASSLNELVATIRPKNAEPTPTSVAVEAAPILADHVGRMLVDHNGNLIGSRTWSVI